MQIDASHAPLLEAVADAPPGLIRGAIRLAGVTILQLLTWLMQPANLAKFVTIIAEFSTNPLQAIFDLATLLAGAFGKPAPAPMP